MNHFLCDCLTEPKFLGAVYYFTDTRHHFFISPLTLTEYLYSFYKRHFQKLSMCLRPSEVEWGFKCVG